VRQDGTEGFYQSICFGLRQGCAMSRLVIACLALALMAQGAWAKSEDHVRLVSAVSEFKKVVADFIDRNTSQTIGKSF
jgi:hypothetical protein